MMVFRSKPVALFLLVAVTALFGLCLGVSRMEMSDCPTKHNDGALCPMDTSRTISLWQKFTVEYRKGLDALALQGAAPLLVYGLGITALVEIFYRILRRLYRTAYLYHLPPPYLAHLFSQGILHPQIY